MTPPSLQTMLSRTLSTLQTSSCLNLGLVDVRPASGSQAEVRAEKRTARVGGSVQDVAFEVQTGSNGDVTICSTFRNTNPCGDRTLTSRSMDG